MFFALTLVDTKQMSGSEFGQSRTLTTVKAAARHSFMRHCWENQSDAKVRIKCHQVGVELVSKTTTDTKGSETV